MKFSDRFIDPQSPDRRPRRAAYALPTLFTAGNLFFGFYSILEVFRGVMATVSASAGADIHFERAAVAIGVAVLLDGLDGRIARLTNTTSDFGREMDSLADVITFGVAPAVLAFTWGVLFVEPPFGGVLLEHLQKAGYFLAFLFLLCCASRLARFNVQKNPVLKNPGRPDRKYFAGLPTPAAAALVAAIVYAADSAPVRFWLVSALWLALLGLLSFLMVSTWRYPSFKDISLLRPRSPLSIVLIGSLIYLIWNYSQPALLGMSTAYVMSGIVIRLGGIARRKLRPQHRHPEHQIG